MRVKIRNTLDLDQPINLRELSPMQKVWVGIVTKWRNSDYYQRQYARQLEEEHTKEIQRTEQLKELILAQVYQELVNNATLKEHGDVCEEIILAINYKSRNSLQQVMKAKDFLQFDLTLVEEDADVRRAFYNMPILLKVSRKKL